ncbi:hypothetical protein Tco_1555682 [Tanacetum coccineum]
MYVAYMYQPWRTLGAIVNRCLSGKTSSNDRLRPSRIKILWGIYHKENIDYDALIWKDLQYQIDNRQSKVRRREITPYPRFTKVIIYHFMSQHKSISNRQGSPYHTVDKDGVLDRLKFTGRGKGAQGSKATVTLKKETAASKKKKAKKIESSDEESKEQEERLIRRKPRGVFIQDTPQVPDELTGKSAVSDEGVGTSPEVSDETKDKSKAEDDIEDWGSDDETFLFDDKDETIEHIPWVSTDEDEYDDEDEEDDESIDIEKTDDERTELDNDDHEMLDAVKTDVAKEHEENAEKLKNKRPMKNSRLMNNQFLNSPNVSLIGIIQENAEVEINSFYVVQRVYELEKDIPELKQVDHTPTILELIKSEVPEAVNKYLGSTLSDTLQKSLLVGENDMDRIVVDPASQRKRQHDDKDQDLPAGSDQVMKKRRNGKDDEPSKQISSQTKHIVEMDVEEPNLDNVTNDVDEPQADAIPKIPKKDWFKKSPRPETLDPN